MQPSAPKVAVIMPAYNASDFIESSVRSILAQSHRNIELIVVNDGSKDNTGEILQRIAGLTNVQDLSTTIQNISLIYIQ